MHTRQAIHQKGNAEPGSMLAAAISNKEDERLEQNWNPPREEIIEMWELFETKRDEGKNDPANPGRAS